MHVLLWRSDNCALVHDLLLGVLFLFYSPFAFTDNDGCSYPPLTYSLTLLPLLPPSVCLEPRLTYCTSVLRLITGPADSARRLLFKALPCAC